MFTIETKSFVSPVEVFSTANRGFTPEEIADLCINKLMYVSDSAPEFVREQAKTFQNAMHDVILFYLKQAVKSDRTTLYNELKESGFVEAAELIRRM